ncbi:putative uncharacterized protein C5orf17 [Papio anubis]|uniref:putative uncharacterized protein C5orf17 n=1 Tax=Papio anubis TaxID=9555 RepID=UPI0012AE0885|nr:putative uncharacterized protein C5orf17 [Papio anubis]
MGSAGPCTRSCWLALPALGSEGLSTGTSSCRGCAGSLGSAGLPALCSNSPQASAASPRGRAQDLQLAMPEPPPPSAVGSWAARASSTSTTPCFTRPDPINCPRAEECVCMVQDWRAAPPVALVRDPLGEASWAPESSGNMENLYV